MDWKDADHLIAMALNEDLGEDGDVTSGAIFADERRRSDLISKDDGVLAGLPLFERVFMTVDPTIRFTNLHCDGDRITRGLTVASVEGPAASLLSAERTALNFLSFLSGIATAARAFVERAGGRVQVLDTRKTLPGFRLLSKYAVAVGGGTNHRMGLHDMVMIKDNHIDMAGSIALAVERVRRRWGDRFRIEVECRTAKEVQEALAADVDVVMLDNMTTERLRACLALRSGETRFEISGNVSLDRIEELAALGADYISVGSITHSVQRFDFSMTAPGPSKDGE